MRIDITRKSFLEAFADAATVAPKTSPKPIIQAVLLRATEDGVDLLATDLDVSLRRHAPGCRVSRPGVAVLPRDRVAAILARAEDDMLIIDLDGDRLRIAGESDQFDLLTEDATLFPAVPDWPTDGGVIEVAAADLRTLIRRTSYAADPASNRYALGGCLAELTGDDGPATLTFVATDGRRIAVQSAPAVVHDDFVMGTMQPVIGMKALKLIDRLLDDADIPAQLVFTSNAVMVRTERAEVFARLVEGRYPRYQDAIPSSPPAIRLPVAAGKLAGAFERARITADVESKAVECAVGPDCLNLAAVSAAAGASSVRLPIAHDGASLAVNLDPDYVLDALKAFPGDAELTVSLTDDRNPALITADNGRFTYVVQTIARK